VEEIAFRDVPVGSNIALRYETVKFGVKVSEDTVEFNDGGFMALIKPDTVRAFVEQTTK